MRRLQFLIYFIYTPKNVTKSFRFVRKHIYKILWCWELSRMRSCLKFPLLGARDVVPQKTLKARTIFRFICLATHNIAKNDTRIYIIWKILFNYLCASLNLREIILFWFFFVQKRLRKTWICCVVHYINVFGDKISSAHSFHGITSPRVYHFLNVWVYL